MLPSIFETVLTRELRSLRRSIELYPSDESLWATPPGISNSGGTLTLHLAGNMQHYIGAVLGGSGYVRNRPLEFSQRHIGRERLVAEVDASIAAVERGIRALTPDAFDARFPEDIAGFTVSTIDFLVHLVAHFGYHLGQIDYHRRLVSGDGRTANALPISELPTFDAHAAG